MSHQSLPVWNSLEKWISILKVAVREEKFWLRCCLKDASWADGEQGGCCRVALGVFYETSWHWHDDRCKCGPWANMEKRFSGSSQVGLGSLFKSVIKMESKSVKHSWRVHSLLWNVCKTHFLSHLTPQYGRPGVPWLPDPWLQPPPLSADRGFRRLWLEIPLFS